MNREEINSLLDLPLAELISISDRVRKKWIDTKFDVCSIMNAKSGLCNQDCKFCAQSVYHKTGVSTYSLKSKKEMIEQARRAKDIGADRFDIVTSGNTLSCDELKRISEAISEIVDKVGIQMCASLGKLGYDDLLLLKKAGLSRYHHNLETSPEYFSHVCTTHSYQERIETIKAAKKAGLEVCSGGIIGIGETMNDRIEMALLLKELQVDSVPINLLVPIEGTPFEKQNGLSCTEAIQTIALFRIILKDKVLKLAAGRESILKDFQAMAFMAGANGMLIGGYLTISGRSVEDDQKLIQEVKSLWST